MGTAVSGRRVIAKGEIRRTVTLGAISTQSGPLRGKELDKAVDDRIWERGLYESDKAYEAFSYFKNLGYVRTLPLTAQDIGKSLSLMKVWCGKYNWRNRVAAWDRHVEREEESEWAKAKKLMARKQAALGSAMQEVAHKRVQQFADSPDLQATMSAGDVVQLAKAGAAIERDARGEVKQGTDNRIFIVFPQAIPWAPKQALPPADDGPLQVLPAEVTTNGD